MRRKMTLRAVLFFTLLLFLVGCSTLKVSYRFLDNAIRWKINDYVTLTGQQGTLVNKDLNKFHHWHRTTQLPVYVKFTKKTAFQLEQKTLSAEDFSEFYNEIYDLAMISIDELVPIISKMLISLEEQQVSQLIKNVEENMEKEFKEDFAGTPKQRSFKRRKRMIKRMAKLTGRLNQSQAALITDWANATHMDKNLRAKWQKGILDSFSRQMKDRSNIEPFLRNMLAQFKTPERFAGAEEKQAYRNRKQLTLQLMSDLFNSLTPQQKKKLIASIKKYQFDFESLVY